MDSEFPDPEDEYDLLHAEEYEVLRELEASQTQKDIPTQQNNSSIQNNAINQNVITQDNNKKSMISTSQNGQIQSSDNKNVKKRSIDELLESELSNVLDINFDDDEQLGSKKPFKSLSNQNGYTQSNNVSTKRSIDQLSESIPLDMVDLDFDYDIEPKKTKRLCWDQPEAIIKAILERRKQNNGYQGDYEVSAITEIKKDSITRKVPLYNFVAITRNEDGERFYIKVSDKKYVTKCYKKPVSNFLIKSFTTLKVEAENIIQKSIEKAKLASLESTQVSTTNTTCELWVDKYRPKRYLDLLSDENINRSLLYWLKLWDKIVFDRDPTVRKRKPQVVSNFKNRFKNKEEDIPDYDSKGFPTHRIVLLSGPPGLGKTTLAHVAARHAGYNVVELNASDDRGPEAFREALLASTQMRAVIDQEKRPNCLVLDEIDGAPAASIELLLKFIQGKLAPKGKNMKAPKENDGCRRPIICICNDLYTPSLRPLRSMALLLSVPEISPTILADRLAEIARKEGLHVDARILLQLAERSACDVRACLGILQYTGGNTNMLQNLAFGLKDMKKGLFDSWKELLQVPMTRKGILSNSERVQNIIKIVHQGETDRLALGIFHNYPDLAKEKLIPVSRSLQWFQFYDQINKLVMERQTWILMPYTTSAFVTWHLNLASTKNPKISYPTALYELNQKLERNLAILGIVKKSSKIDNLTLATEVLPHLPDLLCPRLRSVNAQLYSAKEKQELHRLVNLMLDFGLTFIQVKKAEGGYEYYLDPNIWNIGTFPECKVRKPLAYAVRQIVIQELETARLQRAAIVSGEATTKSSEPSITSSSNKASNPPKPSMDKDQNVPNHLRQLNPKELEPVKELKDRNFFRAFQLAGQEKLRKQQEKEKAEELLNPALNTSAENRRRSASKKKELFKSNVWYQYQEGYSNAIRRTVLIKDLL